MGLSSTSAGSSSAIGFEQILDNWVLAGRLELNDVKEVKSVSDRPDEISYAFLAGAGFSVYIRLYFFIENGVSREYIWAESALVMANESTKCDLFQWALVQNQRSPSPMKFALSEDLLVLSLRCAVDGLSAEYFSELIGGLLERSSKTYTELNEKFGLPTALESLKAAQESRMNLQ